jgi:mannosyl-oligosaccharide alpha-1,2-mannosidase
MGLLFRRFAAICVAITIFLLVLQNLKHHKPPDIETETPLYETKGPINWKSKPQRYPISSMIALPTGTAVPIPSIQHKFGVETENHREERLKKQAAVKEAFTHSWDGYKKHAWAQDEIKPVSGGHKSTFGNRGATLVDSLDTLLIMGMEKEFALALEEVKKIDFSTSEQAILNVFETNIRYLGGLLSAFDLSKGKHQILLKKAIQLGDMLYGAFDTPNRLPVTRWDWER